jgi:hypothetical protein
VSGLVPVSLTADALNKPLHDRKYSVQLQAVTKGHSGNRDLPYRSLVYECLAREQVEVGNVHDDHSLEALTSITHTVGSSSVPFLSPSARLHCIHESGHDVPKRHVATSTAIAGYVASYDQFHAIIVAGPSMICLYFDVGSIQVLRISMHASW